ncbi:MAG: hypothetical protein IJC54_00960 [Clostridia bacterium]|nr:hypothetical protein [Clostridia bacterium]MBQ4085125.1 hypothetical protein [Clostridia bacterium]
MRSILIKDTTREEREQIVREALSCGSGGGCENCSGCGVFGAGDPLDLYKPYIDGEKELRDVTRDIQFGYIRG